MNSRPLLPPPDLDIHFAGVDVLQRDDDGAIVVAPDGAVAVATRVVDAEVELCDWVGWVRAEEGEEESG